LLQRCAAKAHIIYRYILYIYCIFDFIYHLDKKLQINNKHILCILFLFGHKHYYFLGKISKEEIMAEITFLVEGIVCTGCAMDMENIMLDMDGVEEASVNFADGIFSITYNPDEVGGNTIITKVKNLGFKTKILAQQS